MLIRDTDEDESRQSDLVDVDLLVLAELERALAVLLAKGLCLVDLGVFWKLAVRFHYRRRVVSKIMAPPSLKSLTTTSLVCIVLDNNIGLVVLEIPKGDENDVSLVDPDLITGTTGQALWRTGSR